jgi:P-type Cu+ transporter
MDRVSYFVVENLHCPSCIYTVKSTLHDELNIPTTNVNVSLVNQTITVRHTDQITPLVIAHALEKVGFEVEVDANTNQRKDHSWVPKSLADRKRRRRHLEVCKSCQADERIRKEKRTLISRTSFSKSIRSSKSEETTVPEPISPLPRTEVRTELSVSGMSCASCANTISDGLKTQRTRGIFSCDVNVMGNSATVVHDSSRFSPDDVAALIKQIGYSAEVITSSPIGRRPRVTSLDFATEYRLEFHIGGMTCASCSNTITNGLKDEPYIKSVNINLMANSGTVILSQKEDAEKVKETVEEMGFTCDLGEVAPLRPLESSQVSDIRLARIRINDMFCDRCPVVVTDVMQSIPGVIDFTPITLDDPVIIVRYKPSPPEFTIRTIFAALKAENFIPTFEKRPSIEERSRRLQAREQRQILYRIIAAVILAIPTFIIGIVFMALLPSDSSIRTYWEQPIWGNASRDVVALFFLATPAQFFVADHFHRKALHGLQALWRRGSRVPIWKRFVRFGSMDLLISLGTSVAYFSSLILFIMSALAPAATGHSSFTTTFFDTTVFLTMFILFGRFLEAYTKHKAADAVGLLSSLRPTEAILDDSEEERISTDLLEVGDIVKVPNGSSPPGDGIIISGSSKFDESSLTGESRPARKEVGDNVYVGTMNVGGVVSVKLEAIGGSSMLDKIVDIVRQGQSNRAPIERFADTLTGYFVPVIVALAVVTWVLWLSLGLSGSLPARYLDVDQGGWWVFSLQFAIAVFVVACPCGIGLAAPTACYVGSGLAAKYGILVQGGGEAFQEASLVDCVVFDKTGTLTQGGEPQVTDSKIFSEDRATVLGIANELESVSTHTLALAIRSFTESSTRVDEIKSEEMEETGGRGIFARLRVNNKPVEAIIGNEAWMEDHEARYPSASQSALETWKRQGKSVVLLGTRYFSESEKSPEPAFDIVAQFAISDPLRQEAAVVIRELQKQGIATWMISGDNVTTAKAVAAMVGIQEDHVIAGVLPNQKAEKAQWLQKTAGKRQKRSWWQFKQKPRQASELRGSGKEGQRAIVAMVGDGINDAPALAVSDLGIAVGSGSDIAIGSAKFILLASNLLTILTLFNLSATVFRRIKFNFFWYISLLYLC